MTLNVVASIQQATLMNMIFGQFLDHDLSFTPESRTAAEECCTQDAAQGIFEGQCIPVHVPEADDVFRQKVSEGAGVPYL